MPHYHKDNVPAETHGLGGEINRHLWVTDWQTEMDIRIHHRRRTWNSTNGIVLRLRGFIKLPEGMSAKLMTPAQVRLELMNGYNAVLQLLEAQGIKHYEPPVFNLECELWDEEDGEEVEQRLMHHKARVEFCFHRTERDMTK